MSDKRKTLFLDCSEAATCCDKAQYAEANFFEKIKLSIHLLLCKTCRRFSKRNTKLTGLIKDSKLETCPEEKKKEWRETIQKEYSEEKNS